MSVAESQLGYREKIPERHKVRLVVRSARTAVVRNVRSWCARYSGVPESVIPNFSGCFGGVKWFKERGLWRTKEYTPQAGDLLFIDALEDNGARRPCRACSNCRASKRRYDTIEGNSINDMVERRERPRDDPFWATLRPSVRHDRLAIGHDIGYPAPSFRAAPSAARIV